jgi:hypothetical protein
MYDLTSFSKEVDALDCEQWEKFILKYELSLLWKVCTKETETYTLTRGNLETDYHVALNGFQVFDLLAYFLLVVGPNEMQSVNYRSMLQDGNKNGLPKSVIWKSQYLDRVVVPWLYLLYRRYVGVWTTLSCMDRYVHVDLDDFRLNSSDRGVLHRYRKNDVLKSFRWCRM